MKSPVRDRLLLPAGMLALLLLSLAYWWLENLPHEIFGTALLVLLGWHLVVNRYWFGKLLRGRYDARRIAVVALHAILIVNMLILLFTSVVISKSLFAALPIPDSIYLREVHWFSAYWVLLFVGAHLGLHWTRVMALSRSVLRLSSMNPTRTAALRFATLVLAGFGVWSFSVLDVWGKLTFTYSLDVWNFRTSVTPFFGHWTGVVALIAIATHYSMLFWRGRSSSPRSTAH
ncbi:MULTISPECIES: DUF4405 domain-containing protein [Rhizobium/Agrobacterium group]|uniref:DUF4405 domain-containing protein n=1 Tax=Rhizobium/Agrobacterium group TaxID=227290 RepID=UPI002570CAB5|nr:DUF4405 domain-containing protein [Agrobacterium sp. Ap1]